MKKERQQVKAFAWLTESLLPLSGAFADGKLCAETEKFRAFAALPAGFAFAAVRGRRLPLTAVEQIVAVLGLTGDKS